MNYVNMKQCPSCGKVLQLSCFWNDTNRKDGKYWICIECAKKRRNRRKPLVPIPRIEDEEWRPVFGYEGLYEVSNKGRVKSLSRIIKRGKGVYLSDERLLIGGISDGYRHCLLHKEDGSRQDLRVNRLVALAFIPNPDNLPYVNHKDENRLNNNVENLEWCTPLYNTRYGSALEKASLNNGNNKRVCQYDMDGKFIASYYNINQAARSVGGQHSTIVQCCQRIRMSYKGYIWLYEGDDLFLQQVIEKNRKSNNFHRVRCINRITKECAEYGSVSESARLSGMTRAQIERRFKKPELDREYIWIKL